MSDEIETKDLVYNDEYYDSDEDESDDEFELPDENKYESDDEETGELCDILEDLLKEVASVEPIGNKSFQVDFFFPKDIEFASKNSKCDFDEDDEGYPIMTEGGENYFIPYMQAVAEYNEDFQGCTIKTNVKKFTFKV